MSNFIHYYSEYLYAECRYAECRGGTARVVVTIAEALTFDIREKYTVLNTVFGF